MAREIPHRGSRPPLALPEVYDQDSHPSDRFHSISYNSTRPAMSIPNVPEDGPPPPLPPPRHIPHLLHCGPDPYQNLHDKNDFTRNLPSIPQGSSLYGSF